ncbi:MAG: hypothetical protein ABIP44_13950 [Pseudoxanthomonas sp.]
MNMKMKSLSLAVLGLAGLAFAGSASAACVAGNLSAWSATQQAAGTVTVVAGGLNTPPSECKINTTLTGNSGSAGAYVRDDTPANEARYRAQFLINIDTLSGINGTQSVKVFGASTATPSQSIAELVTLTVFGNAAGTTKILGISTVDTAASANFYKQSSTVPLTGLTGTIRVEIDYVKGAAGTLKVWVNNTVEASPNVTLTANNNAWGGTDSVILGLSGASPGYRAANLNKIVSFDQFDSRRQTFIGG